MNRILIYGNEMTITPVQAKQLELSIHNIEQHIQADIQVYGFCMDGGDSTENKNEVQDEKLSEKK